MARPSHAESARTLIAHADRGSLGTLDRNSEAPYVSVVEYVPMPDGDALVFVSSLAEHTKNIESAPDVSLLVLADDAAEQPLAEGRATIVGTIRRADAPREDLAETYLECHPHAETYIDFEDFRFYRIVPERIRYIGGFGRMSWVDVEEYREADPDPVWPARRDIVEHMNDDHADALLDLARELGDADWAERASLATVDRYGFELLAVGDDDRERRESIRLAFDESLDRPDEAREAFIALLDRARS